jgi:peptide/nickel transport system substrate-binding protein
MTNHSIGGPRERVARAAKTGLAHLLATLLIGLSFVLVAPAPATSAPQGEMTWGVHTSLAPTWFDPAETPGIITPFMVLYARCTTQWSNPCRRGR